MARVRFAKEKGARCMTIVRLLLDDPQLKATTSAPVVEGDHGRAETRRATVRPTSAGSRSSMRGLGWQPSARSSGSCKQDRTTVEPHITCSALPYRQSVSTRSSADTGAWKTLCTAAPCGHERGPRPDPIGQRTENIAVLRHTALNAMQEKDRKAPRRESSSAGLDDNFLVRLLELH
jgi:hypothetical protein